MLALGLGKHTFNVNPSKFKANFILYWLDEICYQVVMTLIKSSILCFYVKLPSYRSTPSALSDQFLQLRLFALEERFRYLCYGMLVFVVANGVTFSCVTIFQCRPIRPSHFSPFTRSQEIEHRILTNIRWSLGQQHPIHLSGQ